MHRSAVGEKAVRELGGALALLTLFCGPAWAASPVYVDATGSCGGNTPCFTTIQAGVNNAGGSIPAFVIVYPGTYPENVNLSSMGSAIASTPDSILIAQAGILEELLGLSSSAIGSGEVAPQLAEMGGQSAMASIEAGLASLSAQFANMPTVPETALGTVLVQPPTGPAFFNQVVPFPASVGIYGIDVKSTDDDGIHLNASDNIAMFLVHADGNAGDGFDLTTAGSGDTSVVGCTANENGENGVLARSAAQMFVFNTVADGNMVSGMDLSGQDDVSILVLPADSFSGLPFPLHNSASRNKGIGMVANSVTGTLAIIDFLVVLDGDFSIRTTHIDDNGGTGLQASAGETFNFYGVSANGNAGFGIEGSAGEDVTGIASEANGNDAVGITIGAKAMLGFAVAANQNMNSGWSLAISGVPADAPFSFYPTALALLACSADENMGRGFDVTTPASGATIQAVTAIKNQTDGIALNALAGSASERIARIR